MSLREQNDAEPTSLTYLVGIGVTHSVAPPMHNYVAKSLNHNWQFNARECPTIQDVVQLFRYPTFAGGVVTMPYKIAIMEHLDGLDEHAKLIGACNNVYRARDGTLQGSNTDWRGIKGCLESGSPSGTGIEGERKPALLIGAGGAARAAVYVLHRSLGCSPIYVVNRDDSEVEALSKDTRAYGDSIEIVHLKSVDHAKPMIEERGFPYFVVGTVPDFEPSTPSEIQARDILKYTLGNSPNKGVLLDMCFKPRRTRTIKLAEKYGWKSVEGTGVIGHQIEEQYRLWSNVSSQSPITEEIQEGAWKTLNKAADESQFINF